MQLGLDFCS